jgi:hypothetical protein
MAYQPSTFQEAIHKDWSLKTADIPSVEFEEFEDFEDFEDSFAILGGTRGPIVNLVV